jgi:hypothetical protein
MSSEPHSSPARKGFAIAGIAAVLALLAAVHH